jgi:hypothetical protein
MTIMGTWEIKITRHDGSEYRYPEHRARAPQVHEIIETTDPAGRPLQARILSRTKLPARPGAVGLGIWQVDAKEI